MPDEPASERAAELAADYKALVVAVLQHREAWQIVDSFSSLTDPSVIADTAGYAPYLPVERKWQLLETPAAVERLELLVGWTQDYLAELEVSEKIGEDVRQSVDSTQREFLLRQQLAAIRKELGEGEPDGSDDYRARAEAADVPDAVREALLREVDKLERASEQNPEAQWIRTWLDTVLELPWHVTTADATDLDAARAVLDADHHGLDDVKERIVEHLAVRSRRAERGLEVVGGRGSGAVILLVGPPGVGKTSLGESVARTLGRKFVRVALGGVRDEAEIRGHRRTYVGALPGRIVRAIKEAGSMNPVVLLDEVDKVGSDYRGDPAAALLEVLDPAQNHTFRDHYLELDLDLSDVLFIATANVVEQIPGPLLDRMELVTLDGYTEDDKVAIARDFLVPRQRERAALREDEVGITDAALREIAAHHTREAGVRQLERVVAKAFRKVATRLASGTAPPVEVDETLLTELIGRPRFTPDTHERTELPGVATGLAVTGLGGDVLYVEASVLPEGEAGLRLTGQLGEVMKESAQIALSYVRSHAAELGVDPAALDRPVHVHVPAGAVPKDGPSAGRHDDHRPRVAGDRTAGPRRRRDDRRGVAHRPGAAHRRAQAEAARRAARRPDRGVRAAAQRTRPRRRPGRRAGGADRPPRLRRAGGARPGAGGRRRGGRRRLTSGCAVSRLGAGALHTSTSRAAVIGCREVEVRRPPGPEPRDPRTGAGQQGARRRGVGSAGELGEQQRPVAAVGVVGAEPGQPLAEHRGEQRPALDDARVHVAEDLERDRAVERRPRAA